MVLGSSLDRAQTALQRRPKSEQQLSKPPRGSGQLSSSPRIVKAWASSCPTAGSYTSMCSRLVQRQLLHEQLCLLGELCPDLECAEQCKAA